MKILHTSDWHLGKSLFERSLLDDQRHFLAQLDALLAEDPHDILIIAGDVFDRGVPPEDALATFAAWLAAFRARHPQMPVVITAGNHDSARRLTWGSEILRHQGIFLIGPIEHPDPLRFVDPQGGPDVEIWPLPFLAPHAIPLPADVPATQAATFDHAITQIHARRDATCAQVLVAHCFIARGQAGDSERALLGEATLIEPDRLDGFDYVALGHLHRPQRVRDNAWYSGSPLAYAFAEAGYDKCVLSVHVRRGAPPEVRPVVLRPLRGMREITDSIEALETSPAYEALRDDYLAVTLTGAELVHQPMARLRRRFPHLLRLQQPAAIAAATDGARRVAAEGRSLTDEFADFHEWLRGAPPPDAAREAVQQLLLDARSDA